MDLSSFLDQVDTLKRLCGPESSSKSASTRGQLVLPKLSYSIQGKWTYVTNYQALCRHIGRSIKFLGRFFASKLGASYEINELEFKLRGSNKTTTYKHIQNLLYEEEVLCSFCKSPDTTREDESNTITCSSCQKQTVR